MSAQCKRCRDGVPHEVRHGITGYKHCRCKCAVCREANRIDSRRYADGKRDWQRRRDDPTHIAKRRRWDRDYRMAHTDEIRERKRQDYERSRGPVLLRTSQYAARNVNQVREYHSRRRECLSTSTMARTKGPWTSHEDVVVTRNDITLLEMAHILGRSYNSVHGRRLRLLNPDSVRESSRRYRQRTPHKARQLTPEQRERKSELQRQRREIARNNKEQAA